LDLEGPFFLHTRHLAPQRDFLRRAAAPEPRVGERLELAWRRLHEGADAVIGIHLRRADFAQAFGHQGFEFLAPLRAYLLWLDQLWPRYSRPRLFLASDSLPEVLPAFARYRPVTTETLGVTLPPDLHSLDLPPTHVQRDAAFFPDWFFLTRCQALAISNSTFSFTAAMLNDRASVFARPHPGSRTLVTFDPWDSEPLLFLTRPRSLLLDAWHRLALARRAASGVTLRQNLLAAIRWYLMVLRVRWTACRHFRGTSGLRRELLRPGFYLARTRRYDGDPSTTVASPEIPGRSTPVRTGAGSGAPSPDLLRISKSSSTHA
jgi:hypothetical protein